jgi:hypothetical protein
MNDLALGDCMDAPGPPTFDEFAPQQARDFWTALELRQVLPCECVDYLRDTIGRKFAPSVSLLAREVSPFTSSPENPLGLAASKMQRDAPIRSDRVFAQT